MHNRSPLAKAVIAALCAAALGACGSSHPVHTPPAARLVHVPGSAVGKIVLSGVGAQRIGLTTATVRAVQSPPARRRRRGGRPKPAAGTPTAIIPASAVIYDPSGKTYAFVAVARLTYVEVPVTVDYIAGSSAYLRRGPHAGSDVVSSGAEELYGVQTGVLAQT